MDVLHQARSAFRFFLSTHPFFAQMPFKSFCGKRLPPLISPGFVGILSLFLSLDSLFFPWIRPFPEVFTSLVGFDISSLFSP